MLLSTVIIVLTVIHAVVYIESRAFLFLSRSLYYRHTTVCLPIP